MRLGDAAILWTVETTGCETPVTWNTRHCAGKTSLRVLTPETVLALLPNGGFTLAYDGQTVEW